MNPHVLKDVIIEERRICVHAERHIIFCIFSDQHFEDFGLLLAMGKTYAILCPLESLANLHVLLEKHSVELVCKCDYCVVFNLL